MDIGQFNAAKLILKKLDYLQDAKLRLDTNGISYMESDLLDTLADEEIFAVITRVIERNIDQLKKEFADL